MEDRTSPSQLRDAFSGIANNKAYLTDNDLLMARLEPATLQYLKSKMPLVDGGYDYKTFLDSIFKK